MNTSRSTPISSACRRGSVATLVIAAGCLYSFSGGGGLPGHVRTLAVLPFENQTTQFTLTQEVTQTLQDELTQRLGLRHASDQAADAVLRGRILSYTNEPSIFRRPGAGEPGESVVEDQRRVTITISVELYDAVKNQMLWESSGVSATGEYLLTEGEEKGRQLALRNLVQKVVDGAQSQW